MHTNQQDGNEQAIRELIGYHFEGIHWTPATRPDWASFATGFLPEPSLFTASRPVQVKRLAAFRMIENKAEVNHDLSGYLLVKDECKWRIAAHAWNHASEQMPVPDHLG